MNPEKVRFKPSSNDNSKSPKLHDRPFTFFENQILNDKRLLTKSEIADFLQVSIKMIDRKVQMNEIPYLKVGSLVRFSKEEILAWAKESITKR